MHDLWVTHGWEKATEEEIIAALFNPPPFINPFDMAAIKRVNPQALRKYQNLFYSGGIPSYAVNPLKKRGK